MATDFNKVVDDIVGAVSKTTKREGADEVSMKEPVDVGDICVCLSSTGNLHCEDGLGTRLFAYQAVYALS